MGVCVCAESCSIFFYPADSESLSVFPVCRLSISRRVVPLSPVSLSRRLPLPGGVPRESRGIQCGVCCSVLCVPVPVVSQSAVSGLPSPVPSSPLGGGSLVSECSGPCDGLSPGGSAPAGGDGRSVGRWSVSGSRRVTVRAVSTVDVIIPCNCCMGRVCDQTRALQAPRPVWLYRPVAWRESTGASSHVSLSTNSTETH